MSLGCVYENGLCGQLPQRTKLSRLNERDISLDGTVAQNFIPGLDLNELVLDKYGYIMNSTSIIKDVLDVGLRRLYLDVYWDEAGEKWHLCPVPPPSSSANSTATANISVPIQTMMPISTATPNIDKDRHNTLSAVNNVDHTRRPENVKAAVGADVDLSSNYTMVYAQGNFKCDYKFDFQQFVLTLQNYIDLSDTNVAASLLYLQLRPKLWPDAQSASASQLGQSSLNATLRSLIGARILKPSEVSSTTHKDKHPRADQIWPTLKNVLYSNTYRLVIGYNDTLQAQIPDLQTLGSLAFATTPTISDPASYSVRELSLRNFTDTIIRDQGQWINARRSGVSPVVGQGKINIYDGSLLKILEGYEYWAWGPSQPILYSEDERKNMLSNGYNQDAKLAACAVFGEHGLEVANCNAHFPVLCKNRDDNYDWIMTGDNHTYFDPSCPKHYEFYAPATPLEARAIREIHENFTKTPAWVDFNSLYYPNCWVTGGTNAVCPYNIRQNGRNGIGYIAAAGAVAVFALLFILLFEWDRGKSPLMRKHLRRDKAKSSDFEGVPT